MFTTILRTTMERLEGVENKVDSVEERLSLMEESCITITAAIERTDAKAAGMAKLSKVWPSHFMMSIYNVV